MQPQTIIKKIANLHCLMLSCSHNNKQVLSFEALTKMHLDLSTQEYFSAIVLHGQPDSFCEGLSFESLVNLQEKPNQQSNTEDSIRIKNHLELFKNLLERLCHSPCPVIAMVEGSTQGGGLGLVCASDIVIAADNARFSLPETMFGLIPAVIFPYIVRKIGINKARQLALAGLKLDSKEALASGLVDYSVTDHWSKLRKIIKNLSYLESNAFATMKALIHKHFAISETYMQDAINNFATLALTANSQSRITNFLNGYSPWEGNTSDAA